MEEDIVRPKVQLVSRIINKPEAEMRKHEFSLAEVKYKRREDDMETVLRPLLFFGKLIGLVPHRGWRFPTGVLTLVALINTLAEAFGVGASDEKNRTPFDLAAGLGACFFYSLGFFLYRYFYRKHQRLQDVFEVWRRTSLPHFEVDRAYFTQVNIMAFLVFFSAIPENIAYQIRSCISGHENEFLECTFRTLHVNWGRLVPYHPSISVYLIITNKLVLYAWNFMDILIAGMCRGLAFRFACISKIRKTDKEWRTLRNDYNIVMEAFEEINKFLGPMVFASYSLNTYSLCMQLNQWLTPSRNKTTWDKVYTLWSSLHLVVRVLLVSINAANVNNSARRVHDVIKECPHAYYTKEIVRLEESKCIASITGMGCFEVTRSFILSLVTAVFTFEVVLLQADPYCPTP